jgi:DNA repair exonuclease SbcCD ATPase subunit
MKNIYDILKSVGVEVTEENKEKFDKALNENYKTVNELDGVKTKLDKAEKERDTIKSKYDQDIKSRDEDLAGLKSQLENAGEDATKLTDLQNQFDTLNTKYEEDKTKYQTDLAKQRYEFAIKEKANTLKFSSNSAKKAFLEDVISKDLKMDGDTLLGFDDYVDKYKEEDSGAFITEPNPDDDSKPKPPKITTKNTKLDGDDDEPPEPKERPLVW